MTDKETNDIEQKIEALLRKLDEEDPDKGTLKGELKREGLTIYSNLEEALEARRKHQEELRKRLSKRKPVDKNG